MSSTSCPSSTSPPEESTGDVLYFAFGSNMHVQQMGNRCPNSKLFSKGILRNYKWQTNALGGGNVVLGGPEDFVEGILFTLTSSDLDALRPHEGLDWGYFTERNLGFEVKSFPDMSLQGMKSVEAANILARINSGEHKMPEAPTLSNDTHSDNERVIREALVYISEKYKGPSDIREEYIRRMELAIADAGLLGVSEEYIKGSLYPYLHGPRRNMPGPVNVGTQQKVTEVEGEGQ